MSGSLGSWPISPAANPAKPAPSATSASRLAAGTSFALGRPYRSTNCAKKNSTPRSAACSLICSSFGSPATAISFLLRLCQTGRQYYEEASDLPDVTASTLETAQLDRVTALAGLVSDTPEIVLDLDAVRANVGRIAALAGEAGVSVRPHCKTHKLPQIARLQLDAGAVGVQVAKL